MRITNDLTFNPHPVTGGQPELFHGSSRPSATTEFTGKEIGSIYTCHPAVTQAELYIKTKDDNLLSDWSLVKGTLTQVTTYDDYTDGGGATGTLVLTGTIPKGAFVERCYVVDNAGWATVTTLTIQVGDGSDADRYTTGTPSIATDGDALTLGAPSGLAAHTAAVSTVTVTLTEDDDFTDITAGTVTIVLQYTGALAV